MKAVYIYTPPVLEYYTRQRSLVIRAGTEVHIAKAPKCGKGMSRTFKWIADTNGNFLGMVLANSLVKKSK